MTKNKLTAAFYRNIEGPYRLISVEPTLVVYERAIPREVLLEKMRTRIDYDTAARSENKNMRLLTFLFPHFTPVETEC